MEFNVRYGPKFLRHPPPLAYTVSVVYGALLQANEFNLSRIDVKRTELDALRRSLRGMYPPYLRSKSGDLIPQINDGRMEKALTFLRKHEWIKVEGEFIEIFMSKGKMSGNLIDTFIHMQAQDEYQEYGDKIALGIPEVAETLDRYPKDI